ncbi:MAG: hypothetical protein HN403_00630 [Rhodospirillales bacterium]|nr:hypothetical protein [Rhodospirillales bacterium]
MRHAMLAIFVIMTAVAAVSFMSDSAGAAPLQLAASDQQSLCFNKCLDKYGSDKKTACAMDCGLVQNPNVNAPARDCGIVYKDCMRGCGKDKACKTQCRAARRSCI